MTNQTFKNVRFILSGIDSKIFRCKTLQVHFPPPRSWLKTPQFWKSIHHKLMLFSPIRNVIVQSFHRETINFNISQYQSSLLTKTTSLIFSIRVRVENCLLVESLLMRVLSNCVSCIKVFDSPEISKKVLLLIRSIFRLVFLSHYQCEFFQQELSLNNNTSRGVLRGKFVIFFVASQFGKSEVSREDLSSKIFLDLETQLHLSHKTTGFISSIKVSI